MLTLLRVALTVLAFVATAFLAGLLYWLFTCACVKPPAGPGPKPTPGPQACADHPNLADGGETIGARRVCVLTGPVLSDLTLSNGSAFVYRLAGSVVVGADVDGPTPQRATLTIEPAVTVFGQGRDVLNIARGSKIEAAGERARPIIFTSENDLRGVGNRMIARGEWGGLVINGRAPINQCDGPVAGGSADCESSGQGAFGLFGGADEHDDSGTLSYVRIQFAAIDDAAIAGGTDTSGLLLRGVGRGTEIDFLQVHNSADDGVEFLGGTVNARHLIVTGAADDGLDWSTGWRGGAQFVIAHADNTVHADQPADNAIEGDNLGTSLGTSPDATPRSNPSIANATLIGSSAAGTGSQATVFQDGTAGRLVNSILTNYAGPAFDIDDAVTFANAAATPGCSLAPGDSDLAFASLYLSNAVNFGPDEAAQTAALLAECTGIVTGASTLTGFSFYAGSTVGDPVGVEPGPVEIAVTPVDPSLLGAFFEPAPFIGAVGPGADWHRGWTYQEAP